MKLTEKTVAAIAAPTDRAQVIVFDDVSKGFGVIVSKTGRRTWIVQGWIAAPVSEKARITIGVHGHVRPDGHTWSATLARQRAKELLADMGAGRDPRPSRANASTGAAGPTLRAGLALHVANMRKRGRSPRSIHTLETEVPRLLADWLDRPIVDITGAALVKIHDKLTNGDAKRAATPMLANRLVAHVSAVWNATDRVHELDGRNPARAVERNPYTPSRERLDEREMPAWWTKVQALSPVRRDLQTFVLYTGMRSEAARHARWEHVVDDHDGAGPALTVPKPKGGEARAFMLPLPRVLVEMLKRRRAENAANPLLVEHGGDGGWIFPTLTRAKPYQVIPVSEPKEYRAAADADPDDDVERKERLLPGLHVLRRTYLSIATEAGIGELDRHALANHAFGRQSVNATYISQAFAHLAECQATIAAAIKTRLDGKKRPTSTRGKRGHLHAV